MNDESEHGAAPPSPSLLADTPAKERKDREKSHRAAVDSAPSSPVPTEASPDTPAGPALAGPVRAALGGRVRHLADLVELEEAVGGTAGPHRLAYQPIIITIDALRANAKVFITIREDQYAAWSEGDGHGLVGFSITSNRDPTIYMRSFLINSRELFLESYRDCQEIQLQLYVHTAQRNVCGRVELPPGCAVTVQTGVDRTTVIGLSSFAVEFPKAE